MLFNGGFTVVPTSSTEFYWSLDSLLDPGDQLLTTVTETSLIALGYKKNKLVYTKPTQAAGNYFIIYKLDAPGSISEMWENNNIGYYKLKQEPTVSLPYINDFETQTTGWWHNSSMGADTWQLGTPGGTIISTAFSGSKAFHTAQLPALPAMSRMHLYTPVFDLSNTANPVIELDMKVHSNFNDGQINMSFSIDGGASWKVLDTINKSYNRWYYPMDYDDIGGFDKIYYQPNHSDLFFEGDEKTFANMYHYNSRNADRNTRYITDLSHLSGQPHVQFRFNLASLQSDTTAVPVNIEGVVIDNFSIKNKHIDLAVTYKKALMISVMSQKIKFNMFIKNIGNYISNVSVNKFYLSSDTILDPSDHYLGADSIKGVRPDMKGYVNESFFGPANLAPYSYLIYEIDANNYNIESNENNNIGYWPLALDSISVLPYVMNFNDTIINGWHDYTTDVLTNILQFQFRSRNMLAPSDLVYGSQLQSGQLFTDRISSITGLNQIPYWYVETPSFDFSNYNSLKLSFKLMVIASPMSGAYMEYSTNGGNTWGLFQPVIANSYHWYSNLNGMSQLNGALGWSTLVSNQTILDSVNVDIGFLTGFPNVVFRYIFRSNAAPSGNGYPQGMRLDDFRIDGINNNIITDIKKSQDAIINMYINEQTIYINYDPINDDSNIYTLEIINMLGQKTSSTKIHLYKGNNKYTLPGEVANGMYLINLFNKKNNKQQKAIIQQN